MLETNTPLSTSKDVLHAALLLLDNSDENPDTFQASAPQKNSAELLHLAHVVARAALEINKNPSHKDAQIRTIVTALRPYVVDQTLIDYLAGCSLDPVRETLYLP